MTNVNSCKVKKINILCFLHVSLIMILFPPAAPAQAVGEKMPMWAEGYLDIHHINTGHGDAAFFVFPDGTTMLYDAGAHTRPPGPREFDVRPDDSRTPGEWISRYIMHVLQDEPEAKLDYILLSHFHGDHMGGIYDGIKTSESGAYQLSGVTEVGNRVPFHKVIDRAWPDYDWPLSLDNENINNYRRFLEWHIKNSGAEAEQFNVGSGDQVTLINRPGDYPEFQVRNIAANGKVWTGVDSSVRNHFPPLETLDAEDYPNENMSSLAIRVSYGMFDYFTGGDLVGVPPPGSPVWHDIETPVGKSVGPVDVNVTNHHAHFDAQNENFLRSLRPRVHIIQSWVVNHPAPSTLRRLLSTRLYPGPRDIFSTNLVDLTRNFIGPGVNRIQEEHGHVVIRVKPGGDTYDIYVLDDSNEDYIIKSINSYTSY